MKKMIARTAFILFAIYSFVVSVAANCSQSCVHGTCNSGSCVCDTNWFGTNCDTFICDYANPCLNRATCSQGIGNNFTCTCEDGYSGLLCDCNDGRTPVTLCNETITKDCNTAGSNRGTCVIDHGNATCVCADGVRGHDCTEIYDVCLFRGCRNGGTCVLNETVASGFNCFCPQGYDFTGQCEYPLPNYDICQYNPCKNNGTCIAPVPIDIVNGPYYTCSCQPGYTGQNCTELINYCQPNPCMNDATCSELPDKTGYQCNCPPYFHGNHCQNKTDPCLNFNCFNNGVCSPNYTLSSDGSYAYSSSCNCTNGFHGDKCELDYDECSINPCHNNSTCINLYGSYQCFCQEGWTGNDCSTNIDDCTSNPCQNGGLCVDGINSFTCDCSNTGFEGYKCTFPSNQSCLTHGCYSNGFCEYNSQLGHHTCSCNSGYTGDYCLYKYQSCIAFGCDPFGTSHCIDSKCVCNDDYFGSNCSSFANLTDPCNNNPCNSGSTCNRIDEVNYTCTCPPGLTGPNCALPTCQSTCTNGGTCFIYPGVERCLCTAGWGGADCSYDIDECFHRPCKNGATCNNTLGDYTCNCPSGFAGKNCDVIGGSCDTVVCQNGGTCISGSDGRINCHCTSQYEGVFCEREVCPYANCTELANNGKCDLHCFIPSCNYDGGHDRCYTSPNATDPWQECSISTCMSRYSDGYCDQDCNNGPCLYDGNDCISSPPGCPAENVSICSSFVDNGLCDQQCNTLQCRIDTIDCTNPVYLPGLLVLRLVASASVDFEGEMDQLKSYLNRLINAEVMIESYRELSREEAVRYNLNQRTDITGPVKYWEVTLRVDIQYCVQNCPTSIQQVLSIVEAAYSTGRTRIADFEITGASVQPDPSDEPTTPTTEIIAFVVTVLVCVVLVVVGVAVLGKRVRDNGGIKETLKKIKTRGVWFVPGGNTPEPDTPPQTREPSFASDRRSSSTEFMLGSSPNSERKAGHRWKPLKMTTSEGATCIIGEYKQDSRKWTPLHYEAARVSTDHIMEVLGTSSMEQVNAKGPGGFTPLMVAIMSEEKELTMRRKLRATPVRSDSSSGSEPSEHELLVSRSPKLQHPINGGLHPSHYRNTSYIAAFIFRHADINMVNDYGQTALHLAAKQGRDDYISQLMHFKADPNIQDIWGHTPLHVSIGAATDRAFKALLEYPKASIDMKSQGGVTPLMMSVKMCSISMVQQLLSKGADISTTDNEGRTVIHWAAMINNIEALRLIVKQGPDNLKDAPNGRGETALFLACREGSTECVRYLLFECYANATLLDSLDRSPLQIAFERQHADIVELLQQANQSTGIQPSPIYNQKVATSGVHNPLYTRSSIKLEPGIHMMPPYQPSTTTSLPVPMSLPYLPHISQYPNIPSTSGQHTLTTQQTSLHRVSSIEAELEQLVSSAITYPHYTNPLLNHQSTLTSTTSPPSQGTAQMRVMDANQTSPGHSIPDGISPKVQDYSPVSNHSPIVYPNQDGLQPLQHLPYSNYPHDQSYFQTPSTSTLSSVDQPRPPYNTALQSISHTHLPGGHSPPIGQTVSPNPLPVAPPTQHFAPQQVGVSNTDSHSPLAGYQCFPSPPKEAGEYPYITSSSTTHTVDIVNSLTPSPEDYSSQQLNEGSPQCQQSVLHGQYAYEYTMPQSQFDFHTHVSTGIPPITYNARHESTV